MSKNELPDVVPAGEMGAKYVSDSFVGMLIDDSLISAHSHKIYSIIVLFLIF